MSGFRASSFVVKNEVDICNKERLRNAGGGMIMKFYEKNSKLFVNFALKLATSVRN